MAIVKVPAAVGIDVNEDGEGTTSLGLRRMLAVLFKQAAPGVAQVGRLGNDHFVVTGAPSAMEYRVSAGGLVLSRSASGGVYPVGIPDGVVVATDPASGVNPRVDRIYALQPDPGLDGAAVDTEFIIGVAVGAPAASPLVPALPPGALELARKVVAAGATNTQAGAPFTNLAPVTGLNTPKPAPTTGTVPLKAGYAGTVAYEVRDGIVEVRADSGGITGSFPVGNTTLSTTVPEGIRPKSRNVRGEAYLSPGAQPGGITITPDGELIITNQSGAARTAASFTAMYFI